MIFTSRAMCAMQTTAVMLHHMYSCVPVQSMDEALDTDFLVFDWLKANGHFSSEWINIDPPGESDQVQAGDEGLKRVDWRLDFKNCLIRVMVYFAYCGCFSHKVAMKYFLPTFSHVTHSTCVKIFIGSSRSVMHESPPA